MHPWPEHVRKAVAELEQLHGIELVSAEHCEKVQSENAKLTEENVAANGRLDMQMKEIAKLRAEIQSARAIALEKNRELAERDNQS